MNAHLVGATGAKLSFDQRGATKAFKRADDRERRAPAVPGAERSQACARTWSPNRIGDLAVVLQVAGGQREVPPLDRVDAELPLEVLDGVVGEGEHENP